MASPYIQYENLVSLASDEGYNNSPHLSQLSSAFLLSSCVVMRMKWLWQNPINPITDNEYNDIIDMITDTEYELMLSVGIGTIVPSVTDLSVYDRYLRLDGSTVATSDYPELAISVPSSWIIGSNIQLPDMREKSLHGDNDINVGDIVGENEVTLTDGQMPTHTHVQNPHQHGYSVAVPTPALGGEIPATASLVTLSPSVTGSETATNQNSGNDEPHNNVPESLSVYWWIVAQ